MMPRAKKQKTKEQSEERFEQAEIKVEDETVSPNNTKKRRKRDLTASVLRDENAPKQSRNGYQIFMADVRKKVTEENPDASMFDISKILGQEWRALDEEKRKVRFNELIYYFLITLNNSHKI